jgi:hypothetical protein
VSDYPNPGGFPSPGVLTAYPPIPNDGAVGREDRYAESANLALLSLFVSLIGFVVIAGVLYEFKFDGVTSSLDGLPTRMVFAIGVVLAAAPFAVTVVRRVPILFLAAPVVLLFFLYPIFSPYGIPYDRDAIYVYQLAQTLVQSGSWTPAVGVTNQAVAYSYYPGGAIFIAETASLTSVSLFNSFPWSTELFRFLIIPPIIYALTARFLSPRAAPLAVLLYVVEPSIEMNIPTQQDFAVTFFLLGIGLFAFLATDSQMTPTFLRVSLLMATAVVIVSHHVSTYLLVAVLAAFAIVPRVLWRRDPYPNVHSMSVFVRTLLFAVLWGVIVALPVITQQWTVLLATIGSLVHPSAKAAGAVPGGSFPLYAIAAVGLGILATVVIAILTLFEARRKRDRSFVTVGLIIALLLAAISAPFLATTFNFLALREFEFIGIFLAPVAAWWIVTRLAPGRSGRSTDRYLTAPDQWPARSARRSGRPSRGAARAVLAGALVALFVLAGVLVPLSTRDQFAPVSQIDADSPEFITPTAYSAAVWAEAHLSKTHEVWGDFLAYSVFGGFAQLRMMWDSYALFNGTGFSAAAIALLDTGSYVVTDREMTQFYSYPMFWGPNNDQPLTVLNESQLAKFNDPTYFSLIYVSPVFTVYVVTAIPPVS